MTGPLDRAMLLLNQSRFDLADSELRRVLAQDPDNAGAHALLALCLSERKCYDDAAHEARQAIRLAPGFPLAHYALATILFHQDRYKEADAALDEAIRLDPFDADHFALRSNLRLQQGRGEEALEAAEQGLAIDPDHQTCLNLRALALLKLNRRVEANRTIQGALEKGPENALSHANLGWTLLHQGDHKQALEHFREALRLDPELDWARAGIVEALKARHLVYRLMLRYFLWMSRVSGRTQWVVILGIFFGPRILREIGRANPTAAPFLTVAAVGILVFAYLTWVADPLFNLLLRLNKYGRYALTRDQVVASNLVGLCVLGAILTPLVLAPFGLLFGLLAAAMFLLMILPVSIVFRCKPVWPRLGMAAYTLALFGVGVLVVGLPLAAGMTPDGPARDQLMERWSSLLGMFLLGVPISTWIGAGLANFR